MSSNSCNSTIRSMKSIVYQICVDDDDDDVDVDDDDVDDDADDSPQSKVGNT